MRFGAVAVLGLVLVAPAGYAQSAGAVQKQLNQHAAKIGAWASDPVLLAAVRKQNARKVPLADIQKQDKSWIDAKNDALVKEMTSGPCADHLRELAKAGGYGEAFVTDDQGALVCATERTSDYWQGDEEKWIRAFDGGKGSTYIDRPRRDESAATMLAQISVPVMDGGHAIGVIIVGVRPQQLTQ